MTGPSWTVAVVGGAGAMGRHAVRTIAQLGTARRLIVADRNTEHAERLAREVGGPCEAVTIDATDPEALRALFVQCDAVCNTMGPFAKFAGPIMRAALEHGCHYLDIDDDWQSTVEAFELDELARSEGLTAIVGLGGSPGVTNLMALVACERLDEVESIYTGWSLRDAVTVPEPEYPAPTAASAAVEHWLLQCSGQIRVWEDGALQDVEPVQRLTLDMPGFGRRTVYTMGHPEPITLPRYVRGLLRSLNVQTGPDWLFDHLKAVAADFSAGEISLQEGAARLASSPQRPPGAKNMDPGAPRPAPLPFSWAMAEGLRDGGRHAVLVHPSAAPPGGMGGNTGVPLAIGLELLSQGRIAAKGVVAPEGALDPWAHLELYGTFLDPPATADRPPVLVHEHVIGEGVRPGASRLAS